MNDQDIKDIHDIMLSWHYSDKSERYGQYVMNRSHIFSGVVWPELFFETSFVKGYDMVCEYVFKKREEYNLKKRKEYDSLIKQNIT